LNDLTVDDVIVIPRERRPEFRIAGTPTVLRVNKHGIVKNIWQGKLGRVAEAEVMSSLLVGN
jgi:hypothetical protein